MKTKKYYCCNECLLSLNCDTLNGEHPCEFGFLTNYKSMRLKQYIAQKTRPGVGIDQKNLQNSNIVSEIPNP